MHPPGLQRFALTRDGPASAPRADGLRRAYYGPSHARNAMPGPSVAGLRGCAFAGGSAHSRRHRLGASRLCRGAPALEPDGGPASGGVVAREPPAVRGGPVRYAAGWRMSCGKGVDAYLMSRTHLYLEQVV